MKNRKGFTLIEMIVVLAIISIVSLAAYPNIAGYLQSKQEQYRINQEYVVNKALTQYYALTGRYYKAACAPDGIVTNPAAMYVELKDKTGALITETDGQYQYRNETGPFGANTVIKKLKVEPR